MTREQYERDICARSEKGSPVMVKHHDGFDGWKPKVSDCHENVDHWVKRHPDHTAVRGWIVHYSGGSDLVVYTAHSVVRGPDGDLFDITPLDNSDDLRRGKFVPHFGNDATFLEMKTGLGINLTCLGDCPAPPPDPTWLSNDDYSLPPESNL